MSNWKCLLLVILALSFTGCEKDGTFEENDNTTQKPFEFKRFVSNIVVEEDLNLETLGRQQTVGGVCFIKLKEYPICLQHEVRHCIEGNFHKGEKSDEDCYE